MFSWENNDRIILTNELGMCVEPETRFAVHVVFNGFKLKT